MINYIYTVSDRGNMYKDLENSVKSLIRFVDPNRIIIIHTPEIDSNKYFKFKDMGIINITTCNELYPFNVNKSNKENRWGYYGEKISKLNSVVLEHLNNVCFLDCDTIINSNLDILFNYKFDVAIRIDKGFTSFDINEWVKQFNELNLLPIPMVNTGVMLFKHGYHQVISGYARYYYESVDKWYDFHKVSQFIDQYAITCAISRLMKEDNSFKVWWLDYLIHGMRWENEIKTPYIKHGSRKRIFRKFIRKLGEYVYYVA